MSVSGHTEPSSDNPISGKFRNENDVIYEVDASAHVVLSEVHPEDRDYQRILWRNNPQEPVRTFKLKTLTYGTSCAAFLAVRCLQQVGRDENSNSPLAYTAILRDFYVDDLLTRANTLGEAVALPDELITVLSKGGFQLCKWASNDCNLLPNETTEFNRPTVIDLDKQYETKTLGLSWDCKADSLNYRVKEYEVRNKVTKRTILSIIAQLFDPLGIIGPVLSTGKILLQKLRSLKLNWDESVPINIYTIWVQFIKELSFINELRIPRKVISDEIAIAYEMHGFCDASEAAYGACIYIRTTDASQNHLLYLLCAKSRVALLKTISLPRLKLCGALLLAQLMQKVSQTLNLNIQKNYFWSDSTNVLAWLSSPSNRWKTFVSNRVAEIQTLTNASDWHHVNTKHNPADIISRGVPPSQLLQSKLWWNGPTWLAHNIDNWPINTATCDSEIPEEKTITLVVTSLQPVYPLNRFSSFAKMQRVVAFCLRFIYNCRSIANKCTGSLTCKELQLATTSIIKIVQNNEFCKEVEALKKGRPIDKQSKLLFLNPFIDEQGIIRVGGRLKNAALTFNTKHPMLLPSNHHITKLLVLF